nr:hypothetical protein [Tanacetum cinerariifolium]
FELKKILIDKYEINKSINRSDIQKNLYNALVESYKIDKDTLSTYGDVVTLKRGRHDQDRDEDPSAGSDQGTKRRKSSKDVEPTKGLKSKESKSSSSSKGTQSQHKSSGKSTQAEELEFEAANTEMHQDQGIKLPQKWISTIAKECYKERQPTRTFNKLIGTLIDFPAFVMNRLKIDNLTQEILVGPAFNLLKGTCKSFAELEYHFEKCYKAVNDRLIWHNPKGHEYPFDLRKPLPLIEVQGRQVVPANYFINNNLEYLKGGSSSSKYPTFTTRTKAANVKVTWWYDYGYLEEIVVRRDDNVLYKFKEGDFPRLKLCDIKDVLLLLVQKKLFNLDVHDRMMLHDIASILEMDYLPKRHWSNLEKKRSCIMIKAIDKLLFERRLMHNLEKFVGGRDYENDLRLLERRI